MPSKDKKHVATTVDTKDAKKVENWLDEQGLSMGWFVRRAFYLMKKAENIK